MRRDEAGKMPTKEEKQSSSGSGGSGGGGTTTANSTNTNTSNGSSSEKHKYCLLCNRNDFTLNPFTATIEKDLRAIFNTEVIKTALSCALTLLPIVCSNLLFMFNVFIIFLIPIPFRFIHNFPFNFCICIFYGFLEIIFMFRWISYENVCTLTHCCNFCWAVNVSALFSLTLFCFILFLLHIWLVRVRQFDAIMHACMRSNLDQWRNVSVYISICALAFSKMSTKCQITDHPTIHPSI